MAIYRLIQNSFFGPREIAIMTAAYEKVLEDLDIQDRNDPRTETIALRILHCVRSGEQNQDRLVKIASRGFTGSSTSEGAQNLDYASLGGAMLEVREGEP
jgi:hypothetical protein